MNLIARNAALVFLALALSPGRSAFAQSGPSPSIAYSSFQLDPVAKCVPDTDVALAALGLHEVATGGVYRMGMAGNVSATVLCLPAADHSNHALITAASTEPRTAQSFATSIADFMVATNFRQRKPSVGDLPALPGNAPIMELGVFSSDEGFSALRSLAKAALSATGLQLGRDVSSPGEASLIGTNSTGSVLVFILTSSVGSGVFGGAFQRASVVVIGVSEQRDVAEALRNNVRAKMTPPRPTPR